MEIMKKYITKENIIIITIAIFATILSSFFIFDKILYKGVDTEYHLSRIMGIVNSWNAKDFLAYIHVDETGYGYAMGFFYSNLFMILPCILYKLGVNIFVIYKILIFLCGIFTATSMYICVKNITKSKYSATIAMFLYTTCSYRIITMVSKGFIGELLSFIFIPIIILGLYKLIFENEKKWWIFSLGFVGILNSNLVMTEIMIVISIIMIICNIKTIIKNKTRLIGFLKATVMALLVSAVFWMPMLQQLYSTEFMLSEKKVIYQPFRWIIEFKDLFWGTIQYKNNLASAYGLGLIFIIILPFRLKIKNQNTVTKFCDICILTGLLLLLLMTNFFPWKQLRPIGEMLQFPSRLEVAISAFFAIACGIICGFTSKKKIKIVVFSVIVIWQTIMNIVCLDSCIKSLIQFNHVESKAQIGVEENFKYNICDGLYLPKEANHFIIQMEKEQERYEEDIIKTNDKQLEYSYKKENLTVEIKFTNNNKENTYIEVPLNYYYGYTAKSVNDETYYKIERGESGLVRIYLNNKSEDTIKIYYKTTNIQKISVLVTSVTIIGIAIYIVKKIKNKEVEIKQEE